MPKLLIVDDEDEICGLLEEYLVCRMEIKVFTATSSKKALKTLETEQPDGHAAR